MSEKKEQEPFVVRFEQYGGRGDPMLLLNGLPAYAIRTSSLRPRVGEEWFVRIKSKTQTRIKLKLIRKFVPIEGIPDKTVLSR